MPEKSKTDSEPTAQNRSRVKPELMSPAGYWPQLRAAVEAGADAVYFGLNHFSARAKVGFTLEELPDVIRELHARGVKGFVTFNTLVFDHEIDLARSAILRIADSGADSIIVQDAGIARLASQLVPHLAIHGSTQMSITSAQGAELARSLGCSRVVLGRELSLTDIRKIADQTDVELEVFVHGALCVSYSGQCFSSEAWGGRSANRGKCAQACRLSYDLIVDGERRDTEDSRYLLSPGDLYALEQIPELTDIGVHCLKIEGRYKDADYVALTTAAYRKAIDAAWNDADRSSRTSPISEQERADLEQVYSRGLGPHFMSGTNHQTVVLGRAPRHRGVRIGTVIEVGRGHVVINALGEVRRGDGVVFDAADWRSPDEPEEGGSIYEVRPTKVDEVRQPKIDVRQPKTSTGSFRLEFGRGEIDFSRIRAGDQVWRTLDPGISKRARKFTRPGDPVYTRPLDFHVTADVGSPLKIVATIAGNAATFVANEPLAAASKRPLDLERLQSQLGRLGNTPFHVGQIDLISSSSVFVPDSELNRARRELVDQLIELRTRVPTPSKAAPFEFNSNPRIEASSESQTKTEQSIHLDLLVRNANQLDAAIAAGPESITLDYLELYGLRDSVNRIADAGIQARVASPRILKPGEQNVIRFLVSLDCDILVRSGGLLHDLIETTDVPRTRLHGDFSLNIANVLTAQLFLERGLSRITPTYDLNALQIEELAAGIDPDAIEVIAYSHLPVFHTEHCVFCRYLSEGTDNTNCGHPCEKHSLAIRDSNGLEHPVMADVGCRNTVFGAAAQTDPTFLARWRAAGIHRFRLEFVHQDTRQVADIAAGFSQFFAGDCSAGELTARLEKQSPQGITTGSLFVPRDFKNLVQLN